MLDILLNILALMAAGFAARHLKLVDAPGEKAINDLVYSVGLPALIFSKISAAVWGSEHLPFIAVNVLAVGLMVLLPVLAWRLRLLDAKFAALLLLCAGFGNTGFMGLPIISMKWGAAALAPAALLLAIHNLVVFVLGLWLISFMVPSKGSVWRDIARNPLVLSTLLALAWSLTGLVLPEPISYALDSLGNLAIVLSLLSIGMFFATHRLGQRGAGSLIVSAAKLLVLPLLAILLLRLLHPAGLLTPITLIECMMPVGAANYVISRRLGLDHALAAESILLSTLLAFPLLLGFDWILAAAGLAL